MTPLETYLTALREIHFSGEAVDETSYYGALETLFNEIGKTLKPKVRCILQLKNRGAGNPDGGLFTEDQYKRRSGQETLMGQSPARGVVEVKPTRDDAWVTADCEQVTRYWGKYRQVLVTNYRDFVFVGQDLGGKPIKLETYRLAKNEPAFWDVTARPRKTAAAHEARFIEYVKRAMLHAAPLADPKDVAWFLASYARDALSRIETHELPALAAVRKALEEALGLKFEGEKGEHFFRSTLVQTLFYGVFSAWVLWAKQRTQASRDRFDWTSTARLLRVPVLRKLFHEVADPGQLEELRLSEVLDWGAALLNRVDRASFFGKFQETQAVQYFYEPFLAAFDPKLRKELGVWYIPPEIVRYMVARVDWVLREDLGVAEGLADKNVYVLDPGGGTGSYLVEVLQCIHQTLKKRGEDALLASDLKEAAQSRVFAFEILPASFVVAHLQLSLLLQKLGAPLSDKETERVAVYLSNALTGWEPPKGPKQHLIFPELEEERDAADRVKREAPILVILGNPPYNAFAGVSPSEEEGLVEPYKEGLVKEWGIKKFNLDDLYVRFFRLAERRIVEKERPGRGVVCYISNFSYLGDPSFVVMRKRFLTGFDKLWFDCMNGDSRETGKLTPDRKPDPSAFSTEYNREGIRVGTAIGLMVRGAKRTNGPEVRFRNFWGVTKRSDLIGSLKAKDFDGTYQLVYPDRANRFSFRPSNVAPHYQHWPKVVDLCLQAPISGLQEMRKGSLMDMDRGSLKKRMLMYLDPKVHWDTLRALGTGLTEDAGRFNAKACREKIVARESFDLERIVRYTLYPLDNRWCYHTTTRPLWNEPRPDLAAQCWQGNRFFVTRMMAERPHEQITMMMTAHLPDYHLLRPNAVAIPIWLKEGHPGGTRNSSQQSLLGCGEHSDLEQTANLSQSVRAYLDELGIKNLDASAETAELVWMHALAIGYSPTYHAENADGIRQDWPRVPLPNSKKALLNSAELGRQIAALLAADVPVKGVTGGNLRPEMRSVARPTRAGGGSLKEDELALTAGWGRAGKGGVTMPGKGMLVEREYTRLEREAILAGARSLRIPEKEAFLRLGQSTYDVCLNDAAYWANIPSKAWDYTIGGYQVIKKWLSYREQALLGRALVKDEVRYVQEMARRIVAILLLGPALDENYSSARKHAFVSGK